MDLLKQCPLLICVLLTSLLIPWELFKEEEQESAAPTATAQITTMATETATTTATDNSMSSEADGTNVSGSESSTTTTTTVPSDGCVALENADESYFEDALFIGNSRTVGLYLFGDMPESTDFFADVGLTIYDVMEDSIEVPPQSGSYNTLSSMLNAKQYGKIYIMFGINELGTGTSESFAEYYKSIVDQICQMQPDAIIYIQSIINVSASAETDVISNAGINEKNVFLEQLADNQQIFYINLNASLVDANGYLNSDYTSDGVHLGGNSLPLWKECLLTHAMQKSTTVAAAIEETTTEISDEQDSEFADIEIE